MSAQTYAAHLTREKRRERIDGAMAGAWLAAARLNRSAFSRTRAAYLAAYRTNDAVMEAFYRDRLDQLRRTRQELLDIRRMAREDVDG